MNSGPGVVDGLVQVQLVVAIDQVLRCFGHLGEIVECELEVTWRQPVQPEKRMVVVEVEELEVEVTVHLALGLGDRILPFLQPAVGVGPPVMDRQESARELQAVVENALDLRLDLTDLEETQRDRLVRGHAAEALQVVGVGSVVGGNQRIVEFRWERGIDGVLRDSDRAPEVEADLSVQRIHAPEQPAPFIFGERVEFGGGLSVDSLVMESQIHREPERRSQGVPHSRVGGPHGRVQREEQQPLQHFQWVRRRIDGIVVFQCCQLERVRDGVEVLQMVHRRRDGEDDVQEVERFVVPLWWHDAVGHFDGVELVGAAVGALFEFRSQNRLVLRKPWVLGPSWVGATVDVSVVYGSVVGRKTHPVVQRAVDWHEHLTEKLFSVHHGQLTVGLGEKNLEKLLGRALGRKNGRKNVLVGVQMRERWVHFWRGLGGRKLGLMLHFQRREHQLGERNLGGLGGLGWWARVRAHGPSGGLGLFFGRLSNDIGVLLLHHLGFLARRKNGGFVRIDPGLLFDFGVIFGSGLGVNAVF